MSDFNQSENQTGSEFEEYPELKTSSLPDFNQMITQRVSSIKETNPPKFYPYQIMVKKKITDAGEFQDTTPKQMWPEKDTKVLEDFCKEHGIIGFNCGRMSPIAALAVLKQKLGITDGPIEGRVPYGYEKVGINSSNYSPNNDTKKKILIRG